MPTSPVADALANIFRCFFLAGARTEMCSSCGVPKQLFKDSANKCQETHTECRRQSVGRRRSARGRKDPRKLGCVAKSENFSSTPRKAKSRLGPVYKADHPNEYVMYSPFFEAKSALPHRLTSAYTGRPHQDSRLIFPIMDSVKGDRFLAGVC